MLCRSFEDYHHDHKKCCRKKYFHAHRIARNPLNAFCNGLTNAKQICKRKSAASLHMVSFRAEFTLDESSVGMKKIMKVSTFRTCVDS